MRGTPDGLASFEGAQLNGDVSFSGATFTGGASFTGVRTSRGLDLRMAQVAQGADPSFALCDGSKTPELPLILANWDGNEEQAQDARSAGGLR